MGHHGVILGIVLLANMCSGDGGDTIVTDAQEDRGFNTCDEEAKEFPCGEFRCRFSSCDETGGEGAQGTFDEIDPEEIAAEAVAAGRVETNAPVDLVLEAPWEPSGDYRYSFSCVARRHSDGNLEPLPASVDLDLENGILQYGVRLPTSMDFVVIETDQTAAFRPGPDAVLACLGGGRVIANVRPTAALSGVLSMTAGAGWELAGEAGELLLTPARMLFGDPLELLILDPEDGTPEPGTTRCVTAKPNSAPGPVVFSGEFENYVIKKANPEDPANPCRFYGGDLKFFVRGASPDPAGNDQTPPGPTQSVLMKVPELLGSWLRRSLDSQTRLASTATSGPLGIAGPFFIVGGTREMAIPLPPGVPPPPPGTPSPTQETMVVVLFDALGEEMRVLPFGDAGGSRVSAAVLSHVDAGSSQLQQAVPARTDILVSYGGISLTVTGWNPDIDDFGASEVFPDVANVTDVSPYAGDPESGGAVIVWFGGQRLLFLEYDPSIQFFTAAPGAEITTSQFPGASGGPVSAFRWQAGGQTLFVTDGQPGELWSHPGGTANATKIGNLGNGPRQIRFLGEIGVVSNFDSGTLTIVRRQGNGTVTILGTVNVGDGPIGLDLRLNSAGNIEVLSTGFNDHTYTLTVLSPTGAVIGTPTTRTVPEGGLNPVHAIFVNAEGTRISITCNGSDEVLIFDLP